MINEYGQNSNDLKGLLYASRYRNLTNQNIVYISHGTDMQRNWNNDHYIKLELSKEFPKNSVLKSMHFSVKRRLGVAVDADILKEEGNLLITFHKAKQPLRLYLNVPRELAYKLYYKNTAKEVLSFYSNNIKNKFKVEVK